MHEESLSMYRCMIFTSEYTEIFKGNLITYQTLQDLIETNHLTSISVFHTDDLGCDNLYIGAMKHDFTRKYNRLFLPIHDKTHYYFYFIRDTDQSFTFKVIMKIITNVDQFINMSYTEIQRRSL